LNRAVYFSIRPICSILPAECISVAKDLEVILFNNAGVASSGGATPDTIDTAADAATFIEALGPGGVDVLAH
jgi:hypothetical protein